MLGNLNVELMKMQFLCLYIISRLIFEHTVRSSVRVDPSGAQIDHPPWDPPESVLVVRGNIILLEIHLSQDNIPWNFPSVFLYSTLYCDGWGEGYDPHQAGYSPGMHATKMTAAIQIGIVWRGYYIGRSYCLLSCMLGALSLRPAYHRLGCIGLMHEWFRMIPRHFHRLRWLPPGGKFLF